MVLSWDQRWLSNHLCLQRERTTLYTVILAYTYVGIVYSRKDVTESVDEPTEVVGLAGLPPAEGGCVQMLSSVTEKKLSAVGNGVNLLPGSMHGVCACIPTCAKHFNLSQV